MATPINALNEEYGTDDSPPRRGIGGVLNNSDTIPEVPFFLTQSPPPLTNAEPPPNNDWGQTQRPEITQADIEMLSGPPVSEESLPFMMHDEDNRFPGNNPYDQAGVPYFLRDNLQSNYRLEPFDPVTPVSEPFIPVYQPNPELVPPDDDMDTIEETTPQEAPGPIQPGLQPRTTQPSQPGQAQMQTIVNQRIPGVKLSISTAPFDDNDREMCIACDGSLGEVVKFYDGLLLKYGQEMRSVYSFKDCALESLKLSKNSDFKDLIKSEVGMYYQREIDIIDQIPKEGNVIDVMDTIWETLARNGFYRERKKLRAFSRAAPKTGKAPTRWSIEKDAAIMETFAIEKSKLALGIPPPFSRGMGRQKGYGLDGVPQTSNFHQLPKGTLTRKLKTRSLAAQRPTPWRPEEDHLFAANIQGNPRIPGRDLIQRERRTGHKPPWSQAEDQYLLTQVPTFKRDLARLTTNAWETGQLTNRGQSEVRYRYIYLMVCRNRDNPSMHSPNKDTTPDIEKIDGYNKKEVRPESMGWTQKEDEALAYAVFIYMLSPNLQVPSWPAIQPHVATRDAAQCAARFAILENRFWI